jgi:hypothetical protein
LFANLVYNEVVKSECGFTSVRGFIVILLTFGIYTTDLIQTGIEKLIKKFKNADEKSEGKDKDYIKFKVFGRIKKIKNIENSYDRDDKMEPFIEDFFAITFLGYTYYNEKQRDEIRFIDPEDDKNRDEKFKDPITRIARVVTEAENARNLTSCFMIFLIQMTFIYLIL